jgi:zinc transport system substrate-binding protein
VRDLQGAKVIFTIGKGFDNFINGISDSVPSAQLYEVSKNVELLAGNAQEGEAVNPHYFLSLENGKIITQNIADYLSQVDPFNQSFYQANATNYKARIDKTATQISNELLNLSSRDLITFHDAWPYFAKEFNLKMVATFEPFPGKEPTPQYLKDLASKIKQYKIKVVFAEVQFSTDVIQQFVKDQNVKMYILDPEGRYAYIDLFKHNADIIYQALK